MSKQDRSKARIHLEATPAATSAATPLYLKMGYSEVDWFALRLDEGVEYRMGILVRDPAIR
jgi:hypothetical protein